MNPRRGPMPYREVDDLELLMRRLLCIREHLLYRLAAFFAEGVAR